LPRNKKAVQPSPPARRICDPRDQLARQPDARRHLRRMPVEGVAARFAAPPARSAAPASRQRVEARTAGWQV